MERDPAIAASGLVRTFARARALDGLDLRVQRGEVFGLLGNNGAGKTTTIHILLGLIPATSGEASVLGLDPARHRLDLLQRVGFFPEADRPYEWLRVRQLCRLGELAFARWDRAAAAELCRRFDLDPEKEIKQLSKGMAAKAKLVLALAHHPELAVLDEPTGGLDPGSRHDLLTALQARAGTEGTTVLFSSHNLDDVERAASRFGIIDRGRMVFTASRDQVRRMAVLRFPREAPPPPPPGLDLWRRTHDGAHEWLVRDLEDPALAPVQVDLARAAGRLETRPAPLSEVFLFVTDRGAAAGGIG